MMTSEAELCVICREMVLYPWHSFIKKWSWSDFRRIFQHRVWYNSHIMRNNIFAALAIAVLAGCSPDYGVADYEKGEVAYAARDLQAAVLGFSAAAAKNPTNFMARIKLALVNVDLGEIAAAKAAVESAIAIDPTSAEARLLDGNIAYLAKD